LEYSDNELYHEFVCFATQHMDRLEAKLTSLEKFLDDVFKFEYPKKKMIKSPRIIGKGEFGINTNEVKQLKKEKLMCDVKCDTYDLLPKFDSSSDNGVI
jgi:hypothetical protein